MSWALFLIKILPSPLSLIHKGDISIRTRSIRKQSMTSPLGLAYAYTYADDADADA